MKIKEKYIDLVKSRVEISQLMTDLYEDVHLKNAGLHRKKCCCVFHQEHTPSLVLDTTTNLFYCFGCHKGGDVITLVEESQGLLFDDAVRFLLDRYCPDANTRDLYERQDKEQDEEYRRMQTMYTYNQIAYEYYRDRYLADDVDAIACRAYAEKTEESPEGRWNKEFCRTYGLGYSPLRGNQFLEFARSKGMKLDYLVQLGLLGEDDKHPGNYYDFYRGRLMIPQRDRFGRILTFTARSLQPYATAKYLNGRDSLIYKKSHAVFGIDTALRAARQTGKMYLVEGAPDVMRLQSLGIANVVASLGGSWTKEQLASFQSFGCTLCFIPDSDVPKDGEKFGAGEKFVFANGTLATELGFHVQVRELPKTDGAKQDADSYITDIKVWETLTDEDFIVWYAEKHYDFNTGNEQQLKVIDSVSDLLINVTSELQQASIMAELKSKFGRPTIWRGALAEASKRKKEQKKRQAIMKADELEGFHFFRKGYHYYDIDAHGTEREWSNFVLRPLYLIADDMKPCRIFELENENRVKRTIELQQADVTKLERFKEKIEGRGDFRFFERPEKYELLKAYMYGKTEEAQRVTQMGWNNLGEKSFYAFCNGLVYNGTWTPVDKYGIVRLDNENFYLPAMSSLHKGSKRSFMNERRFLHDPQRRVAPGEYFRFIHEIYGDNGVVAICFYLATLFMDIITDSTRSFPILNIYGKKGTGKTEFAISLISLFQRTPEISNLDSTTYYAMGDKCAEVCNMIVHFDEYKNSLSKKHIDFLKGIYDHAGRIKRSADGERREATQVNCGVLLTGQEMPTVDIALMSRVIFLESQKSEHTKEETDRYHEFIKLRNMRPTNITVELLRYRENFNAGWYAAWKRALHEIKDEVDYTTVGERFINNWAMMLATYYCLKPHIEELPFSTEQVHDICIRGLQYQHSLCNTTDEIAVFWAMFAKSRQLGEIKEGQDYKIVYLDKMKVNTKEQSRKELTFDHSRAVLLVRDKICIAKANMQAKREGKTMIPDESLLSYLLSSYDYYGKTCSPMKFYVLDEHGQPTKHTNAQGNSVYLYDQERVLAFDYEGICTNYDIHLQTMSEAESPTLFSAGQKQQN